MRKERMYQYVYCFIFDGILVLEEGNKIFPYRIRGKLFSQIVKKLKKSGERLIEFVFRFN